MLQKIQALQKRLIAKTEEVVEKDLMIQVWIIWVRVRVRDGVRVRDRIRDRDNPHPNPNPNPNQEKDKLYVELKNILARQPGPEVAEQLSVYQQVRVRVGGTQPLLVKPRPYLNLDP